MNKAEQKEHEKTLIALDVDAWNKKHSPTDADKHLELVEHIGGKKAAEMMDQPQDAGKERHV